MFASLLKCSTVFLFLLLFLNTSHATAMSAEQYSLLKDVPESAWETLATRKIYFGHQSVGYNILDGVRELMKENPQISLNLVETQNSADFDSPLLAHSTVGTNMHPQTKIDAFTTIMEDGLGEKADAAFLKFCYLDFHSGTHVQELFDEYHERLVSLTEKFPNVTFVHFTVPLTSQQTGPKAWVKKMLGKPLRGYELNITRNQFNALLRNEYEGKEALFDLAGIESTFPDGRRASFSRDGNTYYSLVPDYTDDGSHLNEKGRTIVAEEFLLFLVNLLSGE